MSKIMLPSGRIIDRVILVSRVEQIRFKGRKIIVSRVYNHLFDAIVPGFGRDMDFWETKGGTDLPELIKSAFRKGYSEGYDAGYDAAEEYE